jgi:ATP-binding protein involved in chromosome partitioning
MSTPAESTVSEAQVLEALREVVDPDLHKDIVTLNFVKDVRIDGGRVAFAVELTTPACPVKGELKAQAESAVGRIPGVEEVQVEMTARVTSSTPLMGTKGVIEGVRNVVAVSSGKGGVGKSTVAVNLACALQQTGARVGILDADVYGPNIPLMLGLDGNPQATEDNKIMPMQAHDLQVISMALLVAEDQPVIWRGPMLHGVIKQFLFDVAWESWVRSSSPRLRMSPCWT